MNEHRATPARISALLKLEDGIVAHVSIVSVDLDLAAPKEV